jgi:hypothetical protein
MNIFTDSSTMDFDDIRFTAAGFTTGLPGEEFLVKI